MEVTDFLVSAEGPRVQQDTVFKEAVQMMVQAMTLLHQDMRNQIHDANRRQEERMQDALREHEQRMQDALRRQAQDTNKRIRRLEEALEVRERRDAEAQSEEGLGAAGGSLPSLQERHSWREPFAQLEARCKKLEESVERAVESVFPRVALLVSHLEAKAETSPLRDTAGLAVSTTVNSWTTNTITSTSSGASTKSSSSSSTSTSKAPSSSSSIASTSRSLPPANSLPSLETSSQPPPPNTQPPTNRRRSEDLANDLLRAAGTNNLELTRLLLDAGADINCSIIRGLTPLMDAADSKFTTMVALLLQRGADVHLTDYSGKTALHHATWCDPKGKCVRLLLDAGAPVNARDKSGSTALHIAADRGHGPTVRVLLEAGASKHFRNNQQKTPLQLTRNDAVRRLLRPTPF